MVSHLLGHLKPPAVVHVLRNPDGPKGVTAEVTRTNKDIGFASAGASGPNLERWLHRMSKHSTQLSEIGASAGVAIDGRTLHRVAAWGYTNAHAAGGRAWIKAASYEPIGVDHLTLLDAA